MYPTYHANNLREMYVVPNYLPIQCLNGILLNQHSSHYYKVHVAMTLGFDILKNQLLQCVVRFVIDKQKQKQTNAEIGLESEVMASEIVKHTAAGK
ncbi:unnamed protein product [Camellia sinensis]